MKIRVWTVALLLLTGAVARAGDGAGTFGRTESSVLSAEDLATETALASTLSPAGLDASCGPEGWQQYRHGSLWSEYCNSGPCGTADCPQTEVRVVVSHPRKSLVPWPWRGALKKPCSACRQRRMSALDLLRGLFGWNRRTVDHVACQDYTPCQAPVGHHHVDDPVPPPPPPEPVDDPEEAPSPPRAESDLTPSEPLPLELAPTPAPLRDPDVPPSPTELPPAPADDPAPEPQPEIPRNKLPKPQPTNPESSESSRATGSRTVLASRLSDYIHTR